MRAIAKGCPLFARRAHNETHCVPSIRGARARDLALRYQGHSFERLSRLVRAYALGRHPHTTTTTTTTPSTNFLLLLLSRKSFIFVNPFDREERKGRERGMVMFLFGANSGKKKRFERVRNGRGRFARIWLGNVRLSIQERERKRWKIENLPRLMGLVIILDY